MKRWHTEHGLGAPTPSAPPTPAPSASPTPAPPPQVVTTLAVDLSGFDALDPAAAVALKDPTVDLSALTPAAAAAVSGWTVK